MKKAREIGFILSAIVLFLSVAAMETGNVIICGIITAISALVAWICVDKTNAHW